MPSPSAGSSGKGSAGTTPGMAGGATTGEERRAALDAELSRSLGKFDQLLLKEKEVLEQNKRPADAAEAASRGGGSGGSGSGSAGSGSAGSGSSGSGSSGEGDAGATGQEGSESQEAAPGGRQSGDQSAGGAVGGGTQGGGSSPETDSRVPADVSDGHDDDVVARQLREAAMAEKDPELRERLWDEYRAYKSGKRAPRARPAGDGGSGAEQSSDGDGAGAGGGP